MSIENLLSEINEQVQVHVMHNMMQVKAHQLGLDSRAGYRLYVSCEAIAVDKNNDRSLQYYGGFEYVDKDHRVEMGDYVFYTQDEGRVTNCIEHWEELQEAGE